MERQRYYITQHDDAVEFEHVQRLFDAFLELRGERLTTAIVDAYSDDRALRSEVDQARLKLIEIGSERRKARDKGMAVPLDLKDPAHFELLRTFGPYSIYTLVYEEGQDIDNQLDTAMSVDDTGYSIDVLVDKDELRWLADQVRIAGDIFKVVEHRPPSALAATGCTLTAIFVLATIALFMWIGWRLITG